jgi:glycosyltransferase involved in cell wall biosynthesis
MRHLLTSALALALSAPLLLLMLAGLWLERVLGLRRLPAEKVDRMLYLRSQFWFGLTGGGSVGHTSGVIGGLEAAGARVEVVSSDRLHGVEAPIRVVPPEHWFDGALKEAEELAYNLPFLRAALTTARDLRPRAIYQRFTAFNVVGVVLSRLLRVPLVLEFNSSDVWKGRNWGEFRLLGLATLGERVNLAGADRIVVVSRVLRDDLVAAGVPERKIVVNPNAVDPARFRPELPSGDARHRLGLNGQTVVGFSGTFGVWHGIPTLAEVLPRVAEARPDVRFLLIGDGPLRPMLDAVTATAGLEERVVRPGLVPHEQMPELLAACDILLSPHGKQADGREFFGSPTKLYEYMAAGRAIVASRVGQIGDVLRDGETALLIPPDDSSALEGAIVKLVDDRELRDRLGRAARVAAETEHTWRRNAERVLAALAGEAL